MTTQLKAIDFASHPASADPVTPFVRCKKAIALIELEVYSTGRNAYHLQARRIPVGPSLL